MWLCVPGSNNFIPHLSRKANVHEIVAVDVAQLTLAQTKFRAAKAMRMRGHLRPT